MNALFYLANGKGPHARVILLHGFPGNERNLDIAQALRRAGMNVLLFSYRGAWGSGGTFSFTHALEDVASAIHWVRADSSVQAFGIDPKRVILAGHSMGGWLALMGAVADSSIACIVALDFWNVGGDGRRMRRERQLDSTMIAESNWLTAPGGPLSLDSSSQYYCKRIACDSRGCATIRSRSTGDRFAVAHRSQLLRSPHPTRPHDRRLAETAM